MRAVIPRRPTHGRGRTATCAWRRGEGCGPPRRLARLLWPRDEIPRHRAIKIIGEIARMAMVEEHCAGESGGRRIEGPGQGLSADELVMIVDARERVEDLRLQRAGQDMPIAGAPVRLSAGGRARSDADSRPMRACSIGDPVGRRRWSCDPSVHRSTGRGGRRGSDRPPRDWAARQPDRE